MAVSFINLKLGKVAFVLKKVCCRVTMTMDRSDHYDPMELAHADCISTVKRWIERRRVIQLKGLNSEFEGRRATMFHQPTLPTLEEAIAYEAPIRQKLPCPRIIRRQYVRYASDTRIPGIPDFPNLKKNKNKSDTQRGRRRYVGDTGRAPTRTKP
jgi:hypothetical protein